VLESTAFQNVGVQTQWSKKGTEQKTTGIIVSGFVPKHQLDNKESLSAEVKKVVGANGS